VFFFERIFGDLLVTFWTCYLVLLGHKDIRLIPKRQLGFMSRILRRYDSRAGSSASRKGDL
jgi:hypothetical protein